MVNKSAAWRAASASLVVAGCLSVYSACAAALATPNMWDTQERINRYIESGQYDTDVAAVVAQARAYMEQRAPAVSKPAIVLDIDETALTNWPAYRANGWARITGGPCDVERGPCGTLAWQQMAAAKAIAPTLELAKRAEALNVAVFFITGRMENLREATD